MKGVGEPSCSGSRSLSDSHAVPASTSTSRLFVPRLYRFRSPDLHPIYFACFGSGRTPPFDTMNKYLSALALLFMVSADQNIDSTLQHLSTDVLGGLDQLPAAFPGGFNLPSMEEGEELIREKCLKNGKNDSFEAVMAAKDSLKLCFDGIVDIDKMQKEIDEAKPKGELDEVFKKYCRKIPELKKCISNFTTAYEECMDAKEKETKRMTLNITDSLFNFICHKEGDRIALFIAEGGPDCIKSKVDAIQNCVNSSFHHYLPEESDLNNSSIARDLPEVVLDEEKCKDISSLQACVVAELERCSEPTPANIVESLFNFIRKSTPCSQYKFGLQGAGGSASVTTLSFSSLFISFVLLSTWNIFN